MLQKQHVVRFGKLHVNFLPVFVFKVRACLPLADQDRTLTQEQGKSDDIETIRAWLISAKHANPRIRSVWTCRGLMPLL